MGTAVVTLPPAGLIVDPPAGGFALSGPGYGAIGMVEARDALRARRFSWREMEEKLTSFLIAASVARVYATLFPRQWRRSAASSRLTPGKITGREEELLALIDRHLFPVMQEMSLYGDRMWDILLIPMSVDPEYISEAVIAGDASETEWALAILTLLALPNALSDEAVTLTTERAAELAGVSAERIKALGERIVWHKRLARRFRRRARETGEARWGMLPDAMRVLAQNTGSVFLDMFPEDYYYSGEFVWIPEDVLVLARQARRAKRMLARMNAVAEWLAAEPQHWSWIVEAFAAESRTPEETRHEEKKRRARRRAQ